MKTKLIDLVVILAGFCAECLGQGWQAIGPDSSNWQAVDKLTGRWVSSASFHLAAVTSYTGIAIYTPDGSWNYALRNSPPDPYFPGFEFEMLEFTPWETDSIILGYDIVDIEPVPHIVKSSLANLLGPIWTGTGGSWFSQISVVFPANDDSTAIAYMAGVYRSHTRGSRWQKIFPDSIESPFAKLLAGDRYDPNVIYKWDNFTQSLYRSGDQGTEWDSIFALPSSPTKVGLFAQGDTIVVVVRLWWSDTSNVKGIFRSTDGGVSWTNVYNGSSVASVRSTVSDPAILFAAAQEGVLRSMDYGASWTLFNNALPSTDLTDIVTTPNPDTVYVSTGTHGVLKVWNYTVGVDEEPNVPNLFYLDQNHPNPFNPMTVIRYQIPASSKVSLKVYNLLGQEVATLVNEEQKVGGYTVEFNPIHLASGVYLYRLRAGPFHDTKKMIFIK